MFIQHSQLSLGKKLIKSCDPAKNQFFIFLIIEGRVFGPDVSGPDIDPKLLWSAFFFFIDKMFVFHSVALFLICLIVLFLSFLGTINLRRRKMEEKAPRQLVKVSLPHSAVPLCLHV